MPKLVSALLCKDEAGKYLERVLRRCLEFSDSVILLDDGSTDGSDQIAEDIGCEVHRRTTTGMWGNEAPARAELWDLGAKAAGDGWLLICDCDMILHGDPRPLMLTSQHNSWAWTLYDCWDSERHYRSDGFWQGHVHPRPWFFRPSKLGFDTPIWPTRGIHTGHFPQNAKLDCGIADSRDVSWLHLSYVSPVLRLEKVHRYMSQAHQLSDFEKAHALSVGD